MSPSPSNIAPRRVRFEFEPVPRHWIAGRPFVTTALDALHFLFQHGERWFCRVFDRALTRLDELGELDERVAPGLREGMRGFMGQEATHARQHELFLVQLRSRGASTEGISDWIERQLARVERFFPLRTQVAFIAGLEQYTACLGAWVLETPTFDRAHPAMTGLFKWHAAEEIEHKSVAFDAMNALQVGPARRTASFLAASFAFFALWAGVAALLAWRDTGTSRAVMGRDFARSLFDGSLPLGVMIAGGIRYLRPGFEPGPDHDERPAVDYLADLERTR